MTPPPRRERVCTWSQASNESRRWRRSPTLSLRPMKIALASRRPCGPNRPKFGPETSSDGDESRRWRKKATGHRIIPRTRPPSSPAGPGRLKFVSSSRSRPPRLSPVWNRYNITKLPLYVHETRRLSCDRHRRDVASRGRHRRDHVRFKFIFHAESHRQIPQFGIIFREATAEAAERERRPYQHGVADLVGGFQRPFHRRGGIRQR